MDDGKIQHVEWKTIGKWWFFMGFDGMNSLWHQSNMVGGIPAPLKNMKVNWYDDIPNRWENKSHVPVTTNQKWLFT